MTLLIDLNAPDNDTGCATYRKLWRSVLIQALKDGTETRRSAIDMYYSWGRTKDCMEVCQNADISYGIVKKLLKEASENEKKRIYHKNNIFCLSKRRKKEYEISSNDGEYSLFSWGDIPDCLLDLSDPSSD